jgi:hypothetical protein
MRRPIKVLILVALLTLNWSLLQEHARVAYAKSHSVESVQRRQPPTLVYGSTTKFDLLFRDPELALP